MPKLKTHSGAKKRFNLTKTGKVIRAHANKSHILTKKNTKRAHAYKSHILNKKSTKRKRGLRKAAYADQTNMKAIKLLMANH